MIHSLVLQLRGASALGMPVIATEQYPKALGHTAQELLEVCKMTASQASINKLITRRGSCTF
jgi:hypothetical protein